MEIELLRLPGLLKIRSSNESLSLEEEEEEEEARGEWKERVAISSESECTREEDWMKCKASMNEIPLGVRRFERKKERKKEKSERNRKSAQALGDSHIWKKRSNVIFTDLAFDARAHTPKYYFLRFHLPTLSTSAMLQQRKQRGARFKYIKGYTHTRARCLRNPIRIQLATERGLLLVWISLISQSGCFFSLTCKDLGYLPSPPLWPPP